MACDSRADVELGMGPLCAPPEIELAETRKALEQSRDDFRRLLSCFGIGQSQLIYENGVLTGCRGSDLDTAAWGHG